MNFERKTKSILYGMEFTHGMRRALLISLALVYFLSLGFDVVAVTTLFAVSTFIMLIFEFPTSAIADYDSRKKSLIISFFLMFVAFFGIFWFDKFWILAGFWVIGDVAWSFSSGASSAWAIDNLAISEKKDKIVDLVSGGYFYEKWGHLVGGIIGLFIIGYNFRFIWLFISAICFVMVI